MTIKEMFERLEEAKIDMISGFEIDTQNYKYWITLYELDSGLTEGMKEN